jgi:hypothetical protein
MNAWANEGNWMKAQSLFTELQELAHRTNDSNLVPDAFTYRTLIKAINLSKDMTEEDKGRLTTMWADEMSKLGLDGSTMTSESSGNRLQHHHELELEQQQQQQYDSTTVNDDEDHKERCFDQDVEVEEEEEAEEEEAEKKGQDVHIILDEMPRS